MNYEMTFVEFWEGVLLLLSLLLLISFLIKVYLVKVNFVPAISNCTSSTSRQATSWSRIVNLVSWELRTVTYSNAASKCNLIIQFSVKKYFWCLCLTLRFMNRKPTMLINIVQAIRIRKNFCLTVSQKTCPVALAYTPLGNITDRQREMPSFPEWLNAGLSVKLIFYWRLL